MCGDSSSACSSGSSWRAASLSAPIGSPIGSWWRRTRMAAAHSTSVRHGLLAAAVCIAIAYSPDALFGEFLRAWDAPTHIFIASGYRIGWWDIWETRWFGGYSKASYPPLAHQLLAAAFFLVGDKR